MTARDGLHEASAAYALDALDDAERLEFEDHLVSCATCRREVAELADAVDGLGTFADAPAPPPALRASVLAGIVDVPQLDPLPGQPRRALPLLNAVDGEDEDDDQGAQGGAEVVALPVRPPAAADPASEATSDDLALRSASRRTRLLTALVAAVSVVALALGLTVAGLVRQSPPTAGSSVATVDPALLAAPDAKIYPTTLPNGARVSFVVSKARNQAAFVGSDLPSPGAGNEYHLWTLKGPTVVRPDSTLPGGDQSVAAFTGPIDDSDVLAVNVEPTGTNPQTPTTPVLGRARI